MKPGRRLERYRIAFLGLLLAPAFLMPAGAAGLQNLPIPDSRPVVKIGVFDTFGTSFVNETVDPTLAVIQAKLPRYRFELDVIAASNPEDAVKSSGVDFFVSSAGVYSTLERTVGARHIATRRQAGVADPARSVGAVFVVRSDRKDLKTLADLKGKSVVASQKNDFSGWQVAMGEIAKSGFNWRDFFGKQDFVIYQLPDVVTDVLAGTSDVGILTTCALETLESDGWIEKGALRVINEKADPHPSAYTCRRSTDLYPDAVFASVAGAKPDLVRDVTVALLTMPPGNRSWDWSDGWIEKGALRVINEKADPHPSAYTCRRSTDLYPDAVFASVAGAKPDLVRDVTVALLTMPPGNRSWDWSVASDYLAVDHLYKALMIGPYAYLNDMTPYGIWKRNQEIIIPIIALFLLLIAYELRLHYLVKKRTSELSTALKEKEAAEDEAKRSRERLSRLERSGVISQLSSMIAHELKQPLASILNYANGLAQLAKMGRSTPEQTGFAVKSIKTEATRANAIVDRVRAYAKHEEGPLTELDLSDVSHKAIRTFTRNALTPVAVSDAIEPGIRVMGHELELELLTLNLIRNAGDAVKDVADPLIRVTLRRDGGKAVFQVRDNGPVVTDAVLEKLTEIEESVKPEGLGLGLAIVRDIADRHGASLSFRRNDDTGLTAEMRIDMVESKPRDTEEKTGPKGDAS